MNYPLSGAGLRWWMWGSAAGSFIAVLAGGWLTPARGWLHSLFIRLGAEWFGPLLLGLLLGVVMPAVAMAIVLASDNFADAHWRTSGLRSMLRALLEAPPRTERDPFAVERRNAWGARIHVPYHPGVPLWGINTGVALGVVALVAVIGAQVVPLELDTLGVLLRAEARLDGGAAPSLSRRPSGESTLLAGDGAKAEPVLDAFGNAISFERSAIGDSVAYTLRSLGQDGRWSSDDLCVHGHTENLPSEGQLVDAAQFQQSLQSDRVGWEDRLAALGQTRCISSRHSVARALRAE